MANGNVLRSMRRSELESNVELKHLLWRRIAYLKMRKANTKVLTKQLESNGDLKHFLLQRRIYLEILKANTRVLVKLTDEDDNRIASRRRFHENEILPGELVLKVATYLQLQDLKNHLLVNKSFAALGKSTWNAIHIGIQREVFSDYYHLFGTINRRTPDQVHHIIFKEEHREWWGQWKSQEDQRYHSWHGFPKQPKHRPFRAGEAGHVDLYTMLDKEIEKSKTALGKAGELFAGEELEVRARYVDILKCEFLMWTKDWSLFNDELFCAEQDMSVQDLDDWVRKMTAELAIEIVSKIRVLRALKIHDKEACHWEMTWILDTIDTIIDRFDQFRFGRAIGLKAEDVVGGGSMFCDFT
ncbi:MAG: hypothetical protein Q9170_007194 [Blastenia crenularia]